MRLTLTRVASGARKRHGAVRKRHDAALWATSSAMKPWRGVGASGGARPSLGLHGYRQLAKLAYDDGNNNPEAATPPRRINEAIQRDRRRRAWGRRGVGGGGVWRWRRRFRGFRSSPEWHVTAASVCPAGQPPQPRINLRAWLAPVPLAPPVVLLMCGAVERATPFQRLLL